MVSPMSMLVELIFLCSVLGIICLIGERSSYYTKEEMKLIKWLNENEKSLRHPEELV